MNICSPRRRGPAAAVALLSVLLVAFLFASPRAHAQSELLPLDHPATGLLIRIYEYGLIPDFPREHLPISRGAAVGFLAAAHYGSLPEAMQREVAFYSVELAAGMGTPSPSVMISTRSGQPNFFDDPFSDAPFAVVDHVDMETGSHLVFEPVLDGEVRFDPDRKKSAIVGLDGAQLRGSLAGHLGFSARITNGSVAGDLEVARRDSSIAHNGSFGITGFGRDLGFGDGHLRAEFSGVAVEIGHESIQLGGGDRRSLMLSSKLPTRYDYLRFTATLGRFSFSHIHVSVLAEPDGQPSGPFGDIPDKYVALHLLSIGPFYGTRLSIGESVVYHGRGFQLGYLNPLLFMKSQEQYLRDRDNVNLYGALSVNPINGLFFEGELMLDDLRFSRIGSGYWADKSAWKIGGKIVGLPFVRGDFGVSYTRFDPYVFTHFNRQNNYTHDRTSISGGGVEPNSWMVRTTATVVPTPRLRMVADIGIGEHGANIHGIDPITGADTLIYNAGGDIRQTRRDIDPSEIEFLSGDLQRLLRTELSIEYEMLRGVYWRAVAIINRTNTPKETLSDTELRLGLHIGAH